MAPEGKKTTNIPANQKIKEFLEGYFCKKYIGATCVRYSFFVVYFNPELCEIAKKRTLRKRKAPTCIILLLDIFWSSYNIVLYVDLSTYIYRVRRFVMS
jgi:hypothetical protein